MEPVWAESAKPLAGASGEAAGGLKNESMADDEMARQARYGAKAEDTKAPPKDLDAGGADAVDYDLFRTPATGSCCPVDSVAHRPGWSGRTQSS